MAGWPEPTLKKKPVKLGSCWEHFLPYKNENGKCACSLGCMKKEDIVEGGLNGTLNTYDPTMWSQRVMEIPASPRIDWTTIAQAVTPYRLGYVEQSPNYPAVIHPDTYRELVDTEIRRREIEMLYREREAERRYNIANIVFDESPQSA